MRLLKSLDAIAFVDTRLAPVRERTAARRLPAMSLATLLLLSSPLSAGPPFITDDPEPTEYLHWEAYIFSQGTPSTGGLSGVVPPSCDCNYGGFPNVQLHFQPGTAIARESGSPLWWGLGDTEFGLKYRFIEQDRNDWVPSVAVFPKLEVPTGDAARGLGTGRTHAFIPLWLQKDIGDWTTFGGGGFWINPGPGNKDFWFAGWVVERKITGNLTLGVELFYQTPDKIGGSQWTGFNIGGIYDFTDHYHLLFSFGKGLEHPKNSNEFLWYMGLEWTGGE